MPPFVAVALAFAVALPPSPAAPKTRPSYCLPPPLAVTVELATPSRPLSIAGAVTTGRRRQAPRRRRSRLRTRDAPLAVALVAFVVAIAPSRAAHTKIGAAARPAGRVGGQIIRDRRRWVVPLSVLEAFPPDPPDAPFRVLPPLPPIADCVRFSVPVVAPPTASVAPPFVTRETLAPFPPTATKSSQLPPAPPVAVAVAVTAPPEVEYPATAGPAPPFEKPAPPPFPAALSPKTKNAPLDPPPLPPSAVAETVA